MTEIILPGQYPAPDKIFIIDRDGAEVEVSTDELWQYGPDSVREPRTALDLGKLPTHEWRAQGDNDD